MMACLRFIVLLGTLISLVNAYHSCKDLKHYNPNVLNGEYLMFNGAGQQYMAYCEFHGSYGYQFVSQSATKFTQRALDLIAPKTNTVLVRHIRSIGDQYDTHMTQMSCRSHVPLSIQYNQNLNYKTPLNYANWAPYLYLGFLSLSEGSHLPNQGYQANGKDFTYTVCGSTSTNSYLTFFFNSNNGQPTDYQTRCCYTKLMRDWIDVAVPASNHLPRGYFFNIEMHMGGCGGYAINGFSTLNDIAGAALGMRFDL